MKFIGLCCEIVFFFKDWVAGLGGGGGSSWGPRQNTWISEKVDTDEDYGDEK